MLSAVKSEVTDETVLATLRDVVAERPDYRYSAPEYMSDDPDGGRCFYAHKDEVGRTVAAGCVIGAVFQRLGVPLEWMADLEGMPAEVLTSRMFPLLSRRTVDQLNRVQMHQDAGDPWGTAYAKATGETI